MMEDYGVVRLNALLAPLGFEVFAVTKMNYFADRPGYRFTFGDRLTMKEYALEFDGTRGEAIAQFVSYLFARGVRWNG